MNTSNIEVIIKNYAEVELKAVQDSEVLKNIPAGSKSNPSSTKVKVSSSKKLLIQQEVSPTTWYSVCYVDADKLIDGLVVMDNLEWGNVPCNTCEQEK